MFELLDIHGGIPPCFFMLRILCTQVGLFCLPGINARQGVGPL